MVFTEYADTLDWIVRRPRPARLPEAELAVIQGSTPAEEREDIRAQFTADPAGQAAGPGPARHRLPPARASTCRTTATGWSTSTSRSTRPGWSSGSAGSTATARQQTPEIYQLRPGRDGVGVRARTSRFLLDKVRDKIGTVAADLGSVNEVIDADIQDHFTPARHRPRRSKLSARDDGNVIINRALAGGMELNRALTELSRTYDDRKAEMHLTPGERAPRRRHRA